MNKNGTISVRFSKKYGLLVSNDESLRPSAFFQLDPSLVLADAGHIGNWIITSEVVASMTAPHAKNDAATLFQ